MNKPIAFITEDVVSTLSLQCPAGTPIYLGKTNIAHMQQKHPADYEKYAPFINEILSDPEYVGINPTDDSIEYVREFKIHHEFVKVAVRISLSGKYFARSLYALNPNRVHNFLRKGTLRNLTKNKK
jgi:hypothetical protein